MPLKLNPREKRIAAAVIFLLAVLMGYHGVFRPLAAKMTELDDRIFSMELKLRKAKTLLRQKDDILEAAKKFPNLAQMDAGTDEEEIARVLNLIEQTASREQVSLADVKPQAVQSDNMSKRFAVELNAESNLQSLIRFIYNLEHSEKILKVEQVNSSPKEEGSSTLRSFLLVTRVVVK